MIADTHSLNREKTASETFILPKCIKEQILFRKNWFRQNIIESVLQMKKTAELKEFELALFHNKLVSEKEHSDYVNNLPFVPNTKEKTKIEIKDKKRPVSDNHFICQAVEEEGKRRKIDISNRIEYLLPAISITLSKEVINKRMI